MSHFVVEHEVKGFPVFETITGVEDIDTSAFEKLTTLWVCETMDEVLAVETELRRKHARSRQPS